jgi:hypothetical protein
MADYSTVGGVTYALSTSGTLVGVITGVVGGAAVAVVVMLTDAPVSPLLIGTIAALAVFGVGSWRATRAIARHADRLSPRFPTP